LQLLVLQICLTLCHLNTALKKIAAILLIAILFFNWYGYRIVTAILTNDADKQLEVQLDNKEYDESQLIEVRVALNIPYQNDQAEFERHYGEMEVDGKYYTYVKRKIENGFLILKCIPNNSKEMIKAAGNDFFKMTNGLDNNQPDKKQSNSNFAKNFWSEYDDRDADYTIDIFSTILTTNFLNNKSSLSDIYRSAPGQPPENIVSSFLG
jgi:hypothetical protein